MEQHQRRDAPVMSASRPFGSPGQAAGRRPGRPAREAGRGASPSGSAANPCPMLGRDRGDPCRGSPRRASRPIQRRNQSTTHPRSSLGTWRTPDGHDTGRPSAPRASTANGEDPFRPANKTRALALQPARDDGFHGVGLSAPRFAGSARSSRSGKRCPTSVSLSASDGHFCALFGHQTCQRVAAAADRCPTSLLLSPESS